MEEKLLTISEAAKLLEVCENTLRDWDIEGKFKALRTGGGHRRYSLDQIREYLEKNPKEQKSSLVPANQNIKDVVSYWEGEGYLESCESYENKLSLAILLQNCLDLNKNTTSKQLSTNQALWLTKEAWCRSRLKKIVSVQAMPKPCSFAYYYANGNTIESSVVSAKTLRYEFSFFKSGFEELKEFYADAIADEIDLYIAESMPNRINIETIVDASSNCDINLKHQYDYIVGPENLLNQLKSKEPIDLYPMPFLFDENFRSIAIGGRYPVGSLTLPVFMPYLIFSDTLIMKTGIFKGIMRTGWLNKK